MENIDKYFEKNLDKESYNFLVKLVKGWKYNWEDIKEKVDIENKKIIWKGGLDISGTNVKKIKAKRIEWYVDAGRLTSLEDIEIEEEILGYLDIRGTNTDFQLKIIEKVRNGKLKIKGRIYFGGEYFKS